MWNHGWQSKLLEDGIFQHVYCDNNLILEDSDLDDLSNSNSKSWSAQNSIDEDGNKVFPPQGALLISIVDLVSRELVNAIFFLQL